MYHSWGLWNIFWLECGTFAQSFKNWRQKSKSTQLGQGSVRFGRAYNGLTHLKCLMAPKKTQLRQEITKISCHNHFQDYRSLHVAIQLTTKKLGDFPWNVHVLCQPSHIFFLFYKLSFQDRLFFIKLQEGRRLFWLLHMEKVWSQTHRASPKNWLV